MPDPVTPEPEAPGSATPAALDAAAVRRVWDEILGMVSRKSKKVAAWVREATVRDVDGDTLVLTFRYPFHAQALTGQPDLLLEAIYEVLGGRWQIRCELAGDQRSPAPPPRPAAAPPSSAAPKVAARDTDWPEPARPGGAPQPPPAARQATAEEPPFDPEYDAVPAKRGFDGFDPGDEPTDDVVDEATARQTSEQQALHLLQQTLGAEKIGEVEAR
jgi:DNA polymerase III subunit gamma/tau